MRRRSGFTLIELVMATAMFVIVSIIILTGFRFLNDALAHNSILQAEQMVERDFSYLTNDVANAQSIILINDSTLKLRMFNFSLGFNNPALFNDVNIGTVTYQYALRDGKPGLKRQAVFNDVVRERWLLSGMVEAPSAPSPWFKQVGVSLHAVEIAFRMKLPFWKTPKEYRGRVIMQGQGQ